MRSSFIQIVIAGLLLSSVLLLVTNVNAEDPPLGNTITISGEETWTSNQAIGGLVEITSTGNLVIDSANIEMESESSIIIRSGGTLSLINSELSQSNYTSTSISTITDEGKILIPAGDQSGTWIVNAKIIFAEMNVKPGVKWEDQSSWNQVSTNNVTLSTSFTEGDEGKWLDISGSPFEHPIIISVEITINDNEEITYLDPWGMRHDGFMPAETNNSQFRTWSILNQGNLNLNTSSITGAVLSGSGMFDAIDSWYNRSAPIQLTNMSTFNIAGGGINGSATDEDIQSIFGAVIQWNASATGTGGLIDRWTSELGYCQKLLLPAEGIQIEIRNLSYQGTTVNRVGTSAPDGSFTPISCDFSHKRLVEIVDSNGNIWTEEATIVSVIWENSWGTYYGISGTLGWDAEEKITFDSLPHVDITSISLADDTGAVTDSVEVTITMTNMGSAIAIVPVECKLSDSSSADISPQFPTVSINPGQTGEVFVDWRIFNSGDDTLTCNPMLPSSSNESVELLGGSSATSEPFTWRPAAAEVENTDWMSTGLIIAIFVGIALGVGYIVRQKPDEELTAYTEIPDDDENDSQQDSVGL